MSQTNNAFSGGNSTPQGNGGAWANYIPTLTGQTDNPVVTATTSVGRFVFFGALCFFKYTLVSSTMTKTTTTDTVSMSLPIASATQTGEVTTFACRVENATAVANMILGEIASNASAHKYRNYTLAANSNNMTYAATTPGIGVLTNTITLNGAGFYEF
jgi:uncharacterized protein YgbK (DUF1537 family)